ncbi:hexose transporter protein [Lasiosphaeria miniovina]|uniref:Hexose transporter protein n=1 Tax=Lasiosphaeria miniovina TaxID=1954250 RepID=A0AA40DMR1_9PEZI|nr:hexose transporter protein [Lasiosphaeria miniovina]KAK0709414.1 hexose transporter protein [Lasiosphaeria miniovina]
MGKDTFELAGRDWPKVTWWKLKNMRTVYLTLWAAMLTSATNGYDGSLMNGLQAIAAWNENFNNPNGQILGLIAASMSIGSLLAIPVVPYTADILGRRTGVVIGCAIMIVGVALICIGFHVALFIIGRLILGFGIAIAHGSAPLLIAELVHPQHRAIYSTIYNTLWYLGSLVGSWVAFGTDKLDGQWSWRVPCLLQALPSIVQMIFIWTVPESPRWLISKGRHVKAKQILANVHAEGNLDDELVNVEFNEIQQTIALEQEYEKSAWSELWATPGNRHRLIILVSIGFFSQWSGNGIVSYFLPQVLKLIGITDSTLVLEINGYLSIVQLISAVGICFFVDKIGRRPLFITSCIGMLAAFVSTTIALARYDVDQSSAAANTVIVFIFVYYVMYNLGFCGLLVSYSTEILPYRIRAKGLTVMFFCVDLSLWFNQYVNPIALEAIAWKYYLVYCVWLAFELLVVWKYYIETKNTALEEIVKFFDGDAAIVGGDAATAKARHLAGEDDADIPVEEKTAAATSAEVRA